jgi:hypothetical protein
MNRGHARNGCSCNTVYVCLPPLVHQFPLLSSLKAIGAGLITCILMLHSASSPFTYRYDALRLHRYKFCLHIPHIRAIRYKDHW